MDGKIDRLGEVERDVGPRAWREVPERGFDPCPAVAGLDNEEVRAYSDVYFQQVRGKPDELYPDGERVLYVSSTANTPDMASLKAYYAAQAIRFRNQFMRRDVGKIER